MDQVGCDVTRWIKKSRAVRRVVATEIPIQVMRASDDIMERVVDGTLKGPQIHPKVSGASIDTSATGLATLPVNGN